MQIFLNELSLSGQYHDDIKFIEALKELASILFAISDKLNESEIYKSPLLYHREAMRSTVFLSSINNIPDKDLKQRFFRLINNRLNAKDWSAVQEHSSEDSFHCQTTNKEVVNTSLAETAQRIENNREGSKLVVNFIYSDYSDVEYIPIIKNGQNQQPIDLDCVETKQELLNWLEIELDLSSIEFDSTSKLKPTDKQTVLRDSKRFQSTSYLSKHGNRRIYLEKGTNYYWHVDNFHFGAASHLEVFDNIGNHIGNASLKGEIDTQKADSKKKLKL